jgi:protein-L-isoaspartate(D-aspartate) O-methyltransferase
MGLQRSRAGLLAELRREIRDERVLEAFASVPREAFVPADLAGMAYANIPLPIGDGQTISQPIMVAIMLEALKVGPDERVLEVGTGSGYQAALLSQLAKEVVTVERLPLLEERARATLARLGYDTVVVLPSDDVLGCPERAPYDAIIVAAAAPRVPHPLVEQLAIGGRMVVPVGSLLEQMLVRVVKTPGGAIVTELGPCRFVPLIGEEAWPLGTAPIWSE